MQPTDTTPPLDFTRDDDRWQAVIQRLRDADGQFFYAVTTTGVYCRPSCPSRRALRSNVRYFTLGPEAEQAGFRPCQRCRPTDPAANAHHGPAIAAACHLIETAETMPDLAALAAAAGFSPYHFHRLFKRETGVTPRAYAAAYRAARLRAGLAGAETVTHALYDAGYNASSRFYADAGQRLGMKPTTYRRGGTGLTLEFAITTSSLGLVLIAASPTGLCAIEFGDDAQHLAQDLAARFPKATLVPGGRDFQALIAEVIRLIEHPGQGLTLPLDIRATAFQHRVWDALRALKPGDRLSYAALAARIGAPRAVRAVANACAANRLAVAIPCHRVVRSDGTLSGYRWGEARKAELLAREAGYTADIES